MRSYAIGFFLSCVFIVIFSWSLGFMDDNFYMRENKNNSWKQYIYLASNKGYTRTIGFDMSKLTVEDLYTNVMPDDVESTADAAYYEITKDIGANAYRNDDIYFTVYLKQEGNDLYFYICRSISDITNVMKVALREGK